MGQPPLGVGDEKKQSPRVGQPPNCSQLRKQVILFLMRQCLFCDNAANCKRTRVAGVGPKSAQGEGRNPS